MENALSAGTISSSSSVGRVMALCSKMDPKDMREVSTQSDSCQVDILICERWGGSLMQWLQRQPGRAGEHSGRQEYSRLRLGKEGALTLDQAYG